MKIAFVTSDLAHINESFGNANQFAIFDVEEEGFSLAKVVEIDGGNTAKAERLQAKIEAVQGCAMLFCHSIGAEAAAAMVKHRIHPVKLGKNVELQNLLSTIQKALGHNPPPWIRKIVSGQSRP